MSKRKAILRYIDDEMQDSYKKELVKDYINSITGELTKRQKRDSEKKEVKKQSFLDKQVHEKRKHNGKKRV